MKKKLVNIAILTLFAAGFLGCEKWTEAEPINNTPEHSDAYYENLRAYKASDHSITFGWYGNWTGKGASLQNSLMGLPDSVDFVSMWGNWHSLTPEKWADKREVKRLKGTRVLMCFIIEGIGEQITPSSVRNDRIVDGVEYATSEEAMAAFWGWYQDYYSQKHYGDSSPEGIEKAIRKYARSLVDTIDKYEWDGFDFDLERNFTHPGNIASHDDRLGYLVDELGKYLGPTSGTGRMLVVDGEPYLIPREEVEHLDYYIVQAYYSGGYTDLDGRLQNMINAFEGVETSYGLTLTAQEITKRTIFCEDFEKKGYAVNGGNTSFQTRDGRRVPSLIGMAGWEPKTGVRNGGVGTYHMEYDYPNNPEYKWLRMATGIMNPVIK